MDISKDSISSALANMATDLTANIWGRKYTLTSHSHVASGNYVNLGAGFSVFIYSGGFVLPALSAEPIGAKKGFHVMSHAAFEIAEVLPGTTVMIASEGELNLEKAKTKPALTPNGVIAFSEYKVEKPWGYEVWFTQNLEKSAYALKLIYMLEGKQSSLQSHAQKSETNFVLEGVATVLYGVQAPKDLSAQIEISTLERKDYEPGMGWSNKVNELHRVIAKTSYLALEASTPELDDVIRWQDDASRTHGRIDSEHVGSRV